MKIKADLEHTHQMLFGIYMRETLALETSIDFIKFRLNFIQAQQLLQKQEYLNEIKSKNMIHFLSTGNEELNFAIKSIEARLSLISSHIRCSPPPSKSSRLDPLTMSAIPDGVSVSSALSQNLAIEHQHQERVGFDAQQNLSLKYSISFSTNQNHYFCALQRLRQQKELTEIKQRKQLLRLRKEKETLQFAIKSIETHLFFASYQNRFSDPSYFSPFPDILSAAYYGTPSDVRFFLSFQHPPLSNNDRSITHSFLHVRFSVLRLDPEIFGMLSSSFRMDGISTSSIFQMNFLPFISPHSMAIWKLWKFFLHMGQMLINARRMDVLPF
jgi:hypothetical protein